MTDLILDQTYFGEDLTDILQYVEDDKDRHRVLQLDTKLAVLYEKWSAIKKSGKRGELFPESMPILKGLIDLSKAGYDSRLIELFNEETNNIFSRYSAYMGKFGL